MRTGTLALRTVVACILLRAMVGGCSVFADTTRLTVVHVNDVHSHAFPASVSGASPLGGYARLATVVRQARSGGAPVLFLDGGDAIVGSSSEYLVNGRPDYGRVPTYGYRGLEVIDAMNLMGVDAMVLGNHDLDYGKRWLEGLMGRASFPVLSANVLRREIPDVDGATGTPLGRPYVILERGGLRVGIIGLTTQEYIQSLQVQVADPLEAARALLPEVAGRCDLLVVLSHLGYEMDLKLAREVPGIDLIVGAHSHTLVRRPVTVGGTLVVQAGAYAAQVGILEVTVEQGTITSHRYNLKRLDESVPTDPALEAAMRAYLATGSVEGRALRSAKGQRSDLAALATSAMLAATEADAALIGSDSLVGELGPGEPSVEQFFNVFWPYRRRDLTCEKDMGERQLLSTLTGTVNRPLRTMVRDSNGLRTLVVAEVAREAFEGWLRANEGRLGTADYVQVDQRASSPATRSVSLAMPLDLFMGLGRLGLEVDGRQLRLTRVELFEAVLARLRGS